MGERDIYRIFGRKVADLRGSEGLTQAELARKIGLSRASLANIERGEQRVYLHQILSLLGAFERHKIDDLLPTTFPVSARIKSEVTVSGDKLSKAQERVVQELVSSISTTSRRDKK